MTVAEYKELLELAKDKKNWKPELFRRYQKACLCLEPFMFRRNYNIPPELRGIIPEIYCTGIFNDLKKILTKEEYNAFDLEYCEYLRPGTKEGVKYIEELHRKETADQWEQKQTKRRAYKSNPKSNFLTISKELGFQLENKE